MLTRRFYDTKLAQASFLVGCQATGEALVIDPNRDVDQYIAAVEAEGMRLAHVTETHIHADLVSGARELCARVESAKIFASHEGGARYGFDHEKLTFRHAGRDFRLTDVHGNVIKQVLNRT